MCNACVEKLEPWIIHTAEDLAEKLSEGMKPNAKLFHTATSKSMLTAFMRHTLEDIFSDKESSLFSPSGATLQLLYTVEDLLAFGTVTDSEKEKLRYEHHKEMIGDLAAKRLQQAQKEENTLTLRNLKKLIEYYEGVVGVSASVKN